MKTENAAEGRIFYGLHFVPGVAEYHPEDQDPFRVFLNSDALRAMDPSFTGKPVYLLHIDDDDIPEKIDDARKESDGWVIRSFYNAADGKHWVQFMLLTQKSIDAVEKRKWTLSNAYRQTRSVPKDGVWNGVSYELEVKDGEYRHLAIVPNPRYESVVYTPEQFEQYNREKLTELKIANDDGKKEGKSMLKFFQRKKVEKLENAGDLESLEIELPKSKKLVSIAFLVNAVDCEAGKPVMVNMDHHLQMGENTMSMGDFLAYHNKMSEEHASMKDKLGDEDEDEDDKDNASDDDESDDLDNADDTTPEPKVIRANALADDKKKAAEKKARDKKKADDLRNARDDAAGEIITIETTMNQLERGYNEYGSGNKGAKP